MKKSNLTISSLVWFLGISVASLSSSHAQIIALDSFWTDASGYSKTGSSVVGQEFGGIGTNGPGTMGFQGDWIEAVANAPRIATSNLSYTDGSSNAAYSAGGSLNYSLTAGNGRAGRLLGAAYDDTSTGDVYISFMVNGTTLTGYNALELHNGSFDDGATNRKIQIVSGEGGLVPGIMADATNWAVRIEDNNAATHAGDLGAKADGVTEFFVVRITFSATAALDRVRVYRNPTDLTAAEPTPNIDLTGFDLQIDRVSTAHFSGDDVTWDEIRVAQTWADAVSPAAVNTDADTDGMRDGWELAYGLNVGTDDSLTDFDSEGSTNLNEFQKGTNPAAADTDGDTLEDDVETGTGTYVSVSDTGTNPLATDTDGDGLNDDIENNSGTFVSAANPGSNPNLNDTDSDGFPDGVEANYGTDPNSAGSTPTVASTDIVGIERFDYTAGSIDTKAGGEHFDFDNLKVIDIDSDDFVGHTGSTSDWNTVWGTTDISCGMLVTDRNGQGGAGALREFNGPASEAGKGLFGLFTQNEVLYFKVDMKRSDAATWSGLSLYLSGAEKIFFGVPGALNGVDRNFGLQLNDGSAAEFTGTIPAAGTVYTIVGKIDASTGTPTASLWVDPNLGAAEGAADATIADISGSDNADALRLASDGRVDWDNLVVSTTWAALTTASADSDSDGLRDTWENEMFGDLGHSDIDEDSDTLTNSQEQARGTTPTVADTDGDGLNDNIEDGDGTFTSAADPGTDPCFSDTDGDGLSDADEVNTVGSNPLLADTDGDTENDFIENAQGSDPTLSASDSTSLDAVHLDGFNDNIYSALGDGAAGNAAIPAIQQVNTNFGDNKGEWNGGYGIVRGGKLYLSFTGNVENNFNKIEVFIDSTSSGTTNTLDAQGNDGSDAMDGLVFDTAFTPDYHIIGRRDDTRFDLDFSDLAASTFDSYGDVFGGSGWGSATTATGTVNTNSGIGVAYDNSNVAGVGDGKDASDTAAASAVRTGFELCIDLADLGNPPGDIRVALIQNNNDHSFVSNQILGSLPAPVSPAEQDNLGDPTAIDFSAISGDQFYIIPYTAPVVSNLEITACSLSGTTFSITVNGLVASSQYHIESSPDLATWTDVTSSTWTAGAISEVQNVTGVDTATNARMFYRIAEGAGS